ncbi:Bud site selection protein 6 [Chytridiales sp. JEL 0842]|nr:Bud site selection protein 6 [Chytridiales sp. JEL 0842]
MEPTMMTEVVQSLTVRCKRVLVGLTMAAARKDTPSDRASSNLSTQVNDLVRTSAEFLKEFEAVLKDQLSPSNLEAIKDLSLYSSTPDRYSATECDEQVRQLVSKVLQVLGQIKTDTRLRSCVDRGVNALFSSATNSTQEVVASPSNITVDANNDKDKETPHNTVTPPIKSPPRLLSARSCATLVAEDQEEKAFESQKNDVKPESNNSFDNLVTKQEFAQALAQLRSGFFELKQVMENKGSSNLTRASLKGSKANHTDVSSAKRAPRLRRNMLMAHRMRNLLKNSNIIKPSSQLPDITSEITPLTPKNRSSLQSPQESSPPLMRSTESVEALQAQLKSLKRDLQTLQTHYKQLTNAMCNTVQNAISKTAKAAQHNMSHSSHHRAQNNQRSKAFAAKPRIQSQTETLTVKLDALREVVEELRLDAVSFARAKRYVTNPVNSEDGSLQYPLLLKALEEANSINTLTKSLSESLDDARPQWKQVWEKELQNIVAEQAFLKDHERVVTQAETDLSEIINVIKALMMVVEIQEKEMEERRAAGLVVSNDIARGFENVLSPEEIKEGYQNLLLEMRMIVESTSASSERRLKAIERAEKLRKWEQTLKVNEFEQELKAVVGGGQLRKIGGVDHVENSRRQKERALWSTIFAGASFSV